MASTPRRCTGTRTTRAKYVFLPGSVEDRIDLHPRSAALLADADRVFFALEGALKNDAILSAGEAVFSVPSVTLWKPEELQRFAKDFLAGKTVFVVPDADWIGNPMVDWQALLVRTYLREALGDALVHIAAPPVEFFHDTGEKGVDDWLGTYGREWAQRNAVTAGIDGLVIRARNRGSRSGNPSLGAPARTRSYTQSSRLPTRRQNTTRGACATR